jgi:hypothetical protein
VFYVIVLLRILVKNVSLVHKQKISYAIFFLNMFFKHVCNGTLCDIFSSIFLNMPYFIMYLL